MRISLIAVAISVVVGCASAPGQLRFHNQPPVLQVNDREDIPKPKNREFVHFPHLANSYLFRRIPRTLEFNAPHRAEGVNSLDEVPNSTWFTNRIGVREMTVQEVRLGPNRDGSPEAHRPWMIRSTKVGGASIGFIIQDKRGIKYILKFDPPSFPEVETGADIIVQRLLWASGYNTPDDTIVYFRPEDLVIGPKSLVKLRHSKERPMTQVDLNESLAKIHVNPDGRIRGLVSRFVSGIPVGGYPYEGVRGDDTNDRIPHEKRRDVRGQSGFFSWLQHTDLREDNTLDAWSEDPKDPKRHYLVHYLIDFGKAMGSMGIIEARKQIGHSHATDLKHMALTLPTLGLWKRPWEDRTRPDVVGVGMIDSKTYSPGTFVTNLPYFPFYDADRFDHFWAAKILVRFTPEQIRAVVEEARYTDPRATEYLAKILVERQQIAAKHWFARVNPLDDFQVDGTRLCMDDLMRKYHLRSETKGKSSYSARTFDSKGVALAWRPQVEAKPGDSGHLCLEGIPVSSEGDGYTIVRITTHRGAKTLPPVDVHLARASDSSQLRVIGIRRH